MYQVAISREDFGLEDADGDGMVFQAGDEDAFLQTDEEGRYWMPLLDFVTGMGWRFWDEEQRDWLDQWDDQTRMPKMLELSLSVLPSGAPSDRFRSAGPPDNEGAGCQLVFFETAPDSASSPTAGPSRRGAGQQPGGGGGRGGEDGFRRGDGKERRSPVEGPPGGGRPEGGRREGGRRGKNGGGGSMEIRAAVELAAPGLRGRHPAAVAARHPRFQNETLLDQIQQTPA